MKVLSIFGFFIVSLILSNSHAVVHCDEAYAKLAATKYHYIATYDSKHLVRTAKAKLKEDSDKVLYEVAVTDYYESDWPLEVIYDVLLKELSTNCETVKVSQKQKAILVDEFRIIIQ